MHWRYSITPQNPLIQPLYDLGKSMKTESEVIFWHFNDRQVLTTNTILYLANSNTHSKRSSTLIAAVKDYPISKSCSVVNLYLQKEEHKSVKFVEYSVTGILIIFITWLQRSFYITHDSWYAKNPIKRIFTRNLFISLAFPMTIKHFWKV